MQKSRQYAPIIKMSLDSSHKTSRLHPRNKNRKRYNLPKLLHHKPDLKKYCITTKTGALSIDFSNPIAVKLLNQALLKESYGIEHWNFPDENLCPPIPGRADYLHYLADLLTAANKGLLPKGNHIKCLDIGMGANCIYPILGVSEYDWNFIASDIDRKSIATAEQIIAANPQLHGKINCRLQNNPTHIFKGIVGSEECIDISMCNPPFHESAEAALKGTQRKIKNLSGKKTNNPQLNFAGVSNELIYKGGEYQFISNMIQDSIHFAKQCYWFTSLVSKQAHLKGIYKTLERLNATAIETIAMGTGNKISRIVAWTFLSNEEQALWQKERWR